MGTKFTQLQCKEVICLRDGRRLGFVADVEIEVPQGCISALIVPCPLRFPGLLSRRESFCIPWSAVRRIGPDIVLVDIAPEDCRIPKGGGCCRCP